LGAEKLSKLWLPLLEERIVEPIVNYTEKWKNKKPQMKVEVGVIVPPYSSSISLNIRGWKRRSPRNH
jgi:hypothetical protein